MRAEGLELSHLDMNNTNVFDIFICVRISLLEFVGAIVFNILATVRVISGWVPTCDSAHSW